MPELPDIENYIDALSRRIHGQPLQDIRLQSAFLLRTAEPPIDAVTGMRVCSIRRIGKRIAIGLEEDYWVVLHLMIAGRLHWRAPGAKAPGKQALVMFMFPSGILFLTEAGTRKRASLHLVHGDAALAQLDPGGLEVLEASCAAFRNALMRTNHTLKRALTDPNICSGIGNAYSDEILHRAQLSPISMTQKLSTEEIERLYTATRATLTDWRARLRHETGDGFPEKVTAFHDAMAVHGRCGQPCPVCQTAVQRIRYASNETNYCPRCQTGGKILADRALSRLLKKDWPRTLEQLENRHRR